MTCRHCHGALRVNDVGEWTHAELWRAVACYASGGLPQPEAGAVSLHAVALLAVAATLAYLLGHVITWAALTFGKVGSL